MKRYEVNEYCPMFDSCRTITTTDSREEAQTTINEWKEKHSERKYYLVDNWLNGNGKLEIPE